MIRVATVADCVQNPPRNGVACGRGFTVEHMSKGEQMQEQKMPVVAVVLAAGFGTRFDENNPKQLVSVGGKPIVCWSIEAFENNDRISDIIVVVNERVEETVNELIDEAGYAKVRDIPNYNRLIQRSYLSIKMRYKQCRNLFLQTFETFSQFFLNPTKILKFLFGIVHQSQ